MPASTFARSLWACAGKTDKRGWRYVTDRPPPGRGLASRFTNGVRITTRLGATCHLSPTDPEQFVEHVVNAMGDR